MINRLVARRQGAGGGPRNDRRPTQHRLPCLTHSSLQLRAISAQAEILGSVQPNAAFQNVAHRRKAVKQARAAKKAVAQHCSTKLLDTG